MKMQNVPLDQIVWNPWRDEDLFPINDDHVAGLRASIKEHGFFASVKGRRRNGKVELGCGHARFEAARKARLDSIPIFVDDIDDDEMLRLMTDENALQSGSTAGATINEVAAVTRRLIEVLLAPDGLAEIPAKQAFDGKLGYQQARGRLIARLHNPDKDAGVGWHSVMRYLGGGDLAKCKRKKQQIIDAISTLKQSNRYDDLVDEALRKHSPPVANKPTAKGTEVAKAKQATPQRRLLDERTANVFPSDHQFHAFREAVTTRAAQEAIPVDQQMALAKSIMKPAEKTGEGFKGVATKKQIGAPYIKKMVQAHVQEGLKKQRDINKQERELYLAEQREARIEDELHSANASLRSLLSAIARLIDLAEEFPAHPKLGGFSARLDILVGAIQQFSKKLK
jgi:hypothetical protein